MSQDFVGGLITEALQNYIDEREGNLLKEGYSPVEAQAIIEEELDQKDISPLSQELVERISDDCVKTFEKCMEENLKKESKREESFLGHNVQVWGTGFDMSMVMYLITIEAADDCVKYMDQLPNDKKILWEYRYCVLHNIHGRACQQFLEILWMLRGGFADAALSRCRSIYELSVVAELISSNDETIAKAYYEASAEDKAEYNWAKSIPGLTTMNKRISFNQLKKLCAIVTSEKWESMYSNACKTIHASPQGTFARIGVPNQANVISVGHSDYGLAEPAIDSAVSFALITVFFFHIILNFDSKMYDRVIQKWLEKLIDRYLNIESTCFQQ